MRDRIAIDINGTPVDAYEALKTKGVYYCAHPGCDARVHAQWGPGHKEVFFYKNPGKDNTHDHSIEGDKTILTIRKPVSAIIKKILSPQGVSHPPINIPKPPKKKTSPSQIPMMHITKFRNTNTLLEIYRSGICSTPGICSWVIDGEIVGLYLSTYMDRQFLFDATFITAQSVLSGDHIIELIPDRITCSGFRAYQSCSITSNGQQYQAYINVNITIQDASFRQKIINRFFSANKHLFLVCAVFHELNKPMLCSDGVWRTTYECEISSSSQIAICPEPLVPYKKKE